MSTERNWFVNCPENGMMYFVTEEAALAVAKSFLSEHLCSIDGWSEEAGDLTMGRVTKRSTKVNERKRPDSSELDEVGCDHDGFCWAGTDWEYVCGYEMLDVMRDEEAAREIARLRAEVEALRVGAEKDKKLKRILKHAIIMNHSEYNLAMKALRRDAESGNVIRGEIVAEVEKSVNSRMEALDAAIDAARANGESHD